MSARHGFACFDVEFFTEILNEGDIMLATFFNPNFISMNLESVDKDELFEEMVEIFVRGGETLDRAAVLDRLFEREAKMSTGVVSGVAIPHAVCSEVKKDMVAVGISPAGIEYGALDGKPVHIVFMLLFAQGNASDHLEVIRKLSLILDNAEIREKILKAENARSLFEMICEAEESL